MTADSDPTLSRKAPYERVTLLIVALLCTLLVLLVSTTALLLWILLGPDSPNMTYANLGHVHVDLKAKQLTVKTGTDDQLLIYVGETVGQSFQLYTDDNKPDSLSVGWSDNQTTLDIDRQTPTSNQTLNESDPGFMIYTVRWHSPNLQSLEDRVLMKGAHWYGGCEVFNQNWPLERQVNEFEPYVTNDIFQKQYGGIMERLWISSRRVAIYVKEEIPLWVEINHANSSCLGLRSQYADSIYTNFQPNIQQTPILEYHIIVSTIHNDTLASFNKRVILHFYGKPTGRPDRDMIQKPIWSTWAKYKKDVNQTRVMEYAKQIVDNRFAISQLEIDDAWATHYGDLVFDPVKFPDPKAMTDALFQMTIWHTTLWTHPFVDIDSDTYKSKDNHKYFLKRRGSDKPVLAIWWDGLGAVIDATNPEARKWYVNGLRKLLNQTGITSLKFDAGETNWLGGSFKYKTVTEVIPPQPTFSFSTQYASMAAEMGRLVEVRVATRTQKLPIFTRLLDRNSRWGLDNGLQSMITATLMASTLGYSFVMPDMVGGNAYDTQPDRELYMRWVQATALLPTVQFSIAPWDYDDEVTKLSKAMMDVRDSYADYIVMAADQSVKDGTPIIQPIWVVEECEETYTSSTQFLLGSIVMVVPVMEPNVTQIDVYLPQWSVGGQGGPEGQWINTIDNQLYNASQTIQQNVTINDLPIYIMGVHTQHPMVTDHIRQILLNVDK